MAAYKYETLLIEKQDAVLTITLNRPERLNAVNDVMHEETAGRILAGWSGSRG